MVFRQGHAYFHGTRGLAVGSVAVVDPTGRDMGDTRLQELIDDGLVDPSDLHPLSDDIPIMDGMHIVKTPPYDPAKDPSRNGVYRNGNWIN